MYIDSIFVNSLNNRPCINITDRKKKREVSNHFGFALEDGKINRLVDSFLLTNTQNMHKRTARACNACMFSQRFQHLSVLIYIDISRYFLSIYRYAKCRINDCSSTHVYKALPIQVSDCQNQFIIHNCEPVHEKTNKMMCAQRRLRSAWTSNQSDQSSLSA